MMARNVSRTTGKGRIVDKQPIQDAIKLIDSLPTLPSVLSKILTAAADPEASALELGQLISTDQSLSAVLLKLVNSAYYGLYRRIDSVTQAIVMLGFFEVRNLTLAATAFRSIGGSSSQYNRARLWRHSLATAMATERCARLLNATRQGCFESGLLHDIGRVVLDLLYPDRFVVATDRVRAGDSSLVEVEREIFGMDHAEVGGLLAERWNLPPAVTEAIQNHHNPENAKVDAGLTGMVAIADYFACTIGFGESDEAQLPPFPDALAERLRLGNTHGEAICAYLEEHRQDIDNFLGIISAGR
jgi:putative nucleotidyltransferase with HDIG domain